MRVILTAGLLILPLLSLANVAGPAVGQGVAVTVNVVMWNVETGRITTCRDLDLSTEEKFICDVANGVVPSVRTIQLDPSCGICVPLASSAPRTCAEYEQPPTNTRSPSTTQCGGFGYSQDGKGNNVMWCERSDAAQAPTCEYNHGQQVKIRYLFALSGKYTTGTIHVFPYRGASDSIFLYQHYSRGSATGAEGYCWDRGGVYQNGYGVAGNIVNDPSCGGGLAGYWGAGASYRY